MNPITRFILRHSWPIVILSTLLTGVGTYYSAQLYANLRTDLEELLPAQARSVLDMNEVTARLEAIDNLSVLVLSEDTQASKRFVIDLVKKLEAVPKETIASVEYNIAKELAFFKKRGALYMDAPELERIRDYVRDKINYETALYNPLTIFSEVEIPEPRLNLNLMMSKYEGKMSAYTNFPGGYYATPDEKKRIILVYKPGRPGYSVVTGVKNAVAKAVAELNPHSYAKDLQILYTGGVQNTIEEQEALVEDLELVTVLTMIVVGIAMWIFYRGLRLTTALMTALLMGTLWTFGASYFAVGYLNANSAFLGAIVIGNGINFPIIFLARYIEERRNGLAHEDSLNLSMTQTASATLTAALAAGLSYGSLSLTSFRGFRQFGIIGLIGMVLCWIAAYTVLPALLTLLDRRRSLKPKGAPPRSYIAYGIARFVSTYPKMITYASIAATVLSIAMFARYSPKILETDLTKLRNKKSMESGSGYLSRYVDEIFQRYLSPLVALPRNRDDALKIAEKLKSVQAAQGKDSLIASVQTIDDFVPKDQDRKIRLVREIEALLTPEIRSRLGPKERKIADEFITPESKRRLTMQDLPPLVLSKFTEKDGSIGKLVVIEPPIETLDGEQLIRFVRELREAADSVKPGTPVAGGLPVSSDLIESISNDGPKATLFAFIAVVLLVVILFRRVRVYGPVVLALVLGVLWLGGIVLGFWFKINFLNFIALPITFGIGVDYGVNVFQRYREEGPGSILKVLRDTGGAVLLCSFTTVTGYASLLIASNQAFVSFGLLAVLGEATCLIAAMFTLPAILLYRSKKQNELNERRA